MGMARSLLRVRARFNYGLAVSNPRRASGLFGAGLALQRRLGLLSERGIGPNPAHRLDSSVASSTCLSRRADRVSLDNTPRRAGRPSCVPQGRIEPQVSERLLPALVEVDVTGRRQR